MRRLRLLLVSLAIALLAAAGLLRANTGRAGGMAAPAVRIRHHSPGKWHARRAARRLAAARALRRRLVFRHRIVHFAEHLLGVPYRYGGTSPRTGFDCSGLVRYVYSHFGISLPHSSWGDLVRGHRVARTRLLLGDLVFFHGGEHVGIYVGHDRFIHAPHTGTVVRISSLNGWYRSRYTGARRVS